MATRPFLLFVSAGLLLVAAGCVVVPADSYSQPYAYGDVVTVAPPAPQVEYIGPPPAVGYLWLGGYWAWRGGRHAWVPGHWEAPHPGYHWVPHEWRHEGPGWRFHQGHWAR
jgi:hypothetical protein